MRTQKRHQLGFTLIELIVALTIAAIVIGIGMPSFGSFMRGAKISTTTNDYVFSLHKARSEAVKRVTGTGLCPSVNSMTAGATCATGTSYASGWIVYADENNNKQQDGGEEILHRMEARTNGFTITSDAVFANQIYFNDSGNSVNITDIPVSGTINISYAGGSSVRNVIVSANGRVTSEEP
jgi:type IV fimbrial biogenesis protein FimT